MAPQPYKPWHLHTNFWATSKLFRALKFSMQGLWNPIREILKKHSGYLACDVQFHPTNIQTKYFDNKQINVVFNIFKIYLNICTYSAIVVQLGVRCD